MSRPPLDLTGDRFGRLVAHKRLPNGQWWCACDCGTYTEVSVGSLRAGRTRSCGCLQRQVASRTGAKNVGIARSSGWSLWVSRPPPSQRHVLQALKRAMKEAKESDRDTFKAAMMLLYQAATGREEP